MDIFKKPYLIIPKLIEQPTWGGRYILEMKKWEKGPEFKDSKIGQSYELYGKSKLSQATSSDYIKDETNTLSISEFKEKRPFPLIKFTQARGNSFQLHIKKTQQSAQWESKAESWFFLEKGKITLGIKKNTDVKKYEEACLSIDKRMKELSVSVKKKQLAPDEARRIASSYVKEKNPWQYVNVFETKKGDSIDLSAGGIHHSWEEDELHPLGNIVYEVQQDVDDSRSTLRSFDQGKIANNGDIRDITIKDYFTFLDSNEKSNTFALQKKDSVHLFNTPYYCLDHLFTEKEERGETASSFHHLFVVDGEVCICSDGNSILVKKGHSCFIPQGITYTIKTREKAELLKTFLP